MNEYEVADSSSHVDLARLLRVLRERKWVIIIPVVVALAAAFVYSLNMDPRYRAESQVLLQGRSLDNALFGAQVFEVYDQERALTTAAGLVTLDKVAERVKADLGTSRSVGSLRQMVTVMPAPAADVLSIAAVSTDPNEAAAVANTFARQFIAFRRDADREKLNRAAAQVRAQVEAMTPKEQSSPRGLTLSQKAEELAVLESMQTGGFELVQEATPPRASFAPRTGLYVGVAGVLGLILGLGIAFLLHSLDRRVKDEETVQREAGAPVIGSIPVRRKRWGGAKGSRSQRMVGFQEEHSPTLESFRTLRSNLKFFQIGRELRTILVTSPLPSEGKSTTSANLALALAMSGSRVVLLEADLRRPKLQEYMGLERTAGFSDLLVGTHSLSEVVRTMDTSRWIPHREIRSGLGKDSSAEPGVLFIPAGPQPPNPAELLAMERTSVILRQVSELCDFLVIDAPPVLLVSDALELAKKVDATILVARLFQTKAEDVRRARAHLEQVGVRPLGAVVLSPVRTKAYYKQYGGYYG